MNLKRVAMLVGGLMCVVAMGCGSHVVPGSGNRQPTDPHKVMVYTDQPKKYEDLGKVEVPVGGDVKWDSQGDATAGFDKLRAEAAARGENGILLRKDIPETVLVTAGDRGTFYSVPVRTGTPKVAVAEAIYVIEK